MDKIIVAAIIDGVRFRDWKFAATETDNGFRIHAEFVAPDMHTGEPILQKSRRWEITTDMTETEIVSTLFKCIQAAIDHEMREDFRYHGVSVFNPHLSVAQLVAFAHKRNNLDLRVG